MSSTAPRSPPPPSPATHVGALLREWRAARRLSQLDLSLQADVSARHLSYVETGKAQPSREMVARLADALAMPLRERNALMIAAGYAPEYGETSLATPEMAPVRRALDYMLRQQEPYPAFAMTRHWDVVLANAGVTRLFGHLRGGAPKHANILRQIFDPEDMRPFVANWDEVARDVIRHLHAEIAAAPSDAKLGALLDEVLAYPDVPAEWRTREPGASPLPLLTTNFSAGADELRFLSTFATFGTSRDVTIDDLRIECLFPADEATAAFCRALAEAARSG
ncbi:MAG TPA: helix-turn-helix transcriptional regulator [Rhodanobacteraceae bacterium]